MFKSKEKITEKIKKKSWYGIGADYEVEVLKLIDDETKIVNGLTCLFDDLGAAGFCLKKIISYRTMKSIIKPLSEYRVSENLKNRSILNCKHN